MLVPLQDKNINKLIWHANEALIIEYLPKNKCYILWGTKMRNVVRSREMKYIEWSNESSIVVNMYS